MIRWGKRGFFPDLLLIVPFFTSYYIICAVIVVVGSLLLCCKDVKLLVPPELTLYVSVATPPNSPNISSCFLAFGSGMLNDPSLDALLVVIVYVHVPVAQSETSIYAYVSAGVTSAEKLRRFVLDVKLTLYVPPSKVTDTLLVTPLYVTDSTLLAPASPRIATVTP